MHQVISDDTRSSFSVASNDEMLLSLGQRVLRAASIEDNACRAYDRSPPELEAELEALTRKAFEAWSDRVREVAAVPAHGAVGLAVKAALILQGFQDGKTDATEVLARSLRDDIARIEPRVVGLMA